LKDKRAETGIEISPRTTGASTEKPSSKSLSLPAKIYFDGITMVKNAISYKFRILINLWF